MQKMRFPLNISFREFECIIQKKMYKIFGVLSGQVKILFVYLNGDDASFFLKITAGDKHGNCVYVHLYFDPKLKDFVYAITDNEYLKTSILKQMKSP